MASYIRFTRVKTVERIERMSNSADGNPRFKFVFTDGDILTTQRDSGWVYSISPDALVGRKVAATYHFTPRGRGVLDGVASWKPAKGLISRGANSNLSNLKWFESEPVVGS